MLAVEPEPEPEPDPFDPEPEPLEPEPDPVEPEPEPVEPEPEPVEPEPEPVEPEPVEPEPEPVELDWPDVVLTGGVPHPTSAKPRTRRLPESQQNDESLHEDRRNMGLLKTSKRFDAERPQKIVLRRIYDL